MASAIETVERAQVDHPVVALGLAVAKSSLPESSVPPQQHVVYRSARGRRPGGALQTYAARPRDDPPTGRNHSSNSAAAARRFDLDPLPQSHLRLLRARPSGVEYPGHRLQTTAIAPSARQRRVVAYEQKKSPSPTVSSASDRRSQMRSSSASNRARRRLCSSSARSKRTVADSPSGSSPSMAARCARSAAISPMIVSRRRLPARRRSRGCRTSVAATGLSLSHAAEAVLDELVEPIVEAGRDRGPALGVAGRTGRVRVWVKVPSGRHGGDPPAEAPGRFGQAGAGIRSAGSSTGSVLGLGQCPAGGRDYGSMSAAETSLWVTART